MKKGRGTARKCSIFNLKITAQIYLQIKNEQISITLKYCVSLKAAVQYPAELFTVAQLLLLLAK
jgi:hypothetical protein